MKYALAPVAALLVGVAILMTGAGLQGTLLPVRASLEAFSTVSIGVMGAAYFLGFTLGCLRGGGQQHQAQQQAFHVCVVCVCGVRNRAPTRRHGAGVCRVAQLFFPCWR